MNFKKFSLLVVIIFISVPFISTYGLGNIAPEPTYLGSNPSVENKINSTFRSADINIQVFDNYSICKGIFVFNNPSSINETVDLIFDPGRGPEEVKIMINETIIPYSKTESKFHWYDVIKFPVRIDVNNTVNVIVTWEMNTVTERKNYHWAPFPIPVGRRYQRNRDCSYYIIGTKSWKEPIQYVNLSFEIRTHWFSEYKIRYYQNDGYHREEGLPTDIVNNDYGYQTLHFNFTTFSDESLEIWVIGNHDNNTNYYYSVMVMEGLFLVLLGIGIIRLFKRKKKKD